MTVTPSKKIFSFRAKDGTLFIKVPKAPAQAMSEWMKEYEGVRVSAAKIYASPEFEQFMAGEAGKDFESETYLTSPELFQEGFENYDSIAELLGFAPKEDESVE